MYPPAVSQRPDGDHPDRAHVVIDLPRVAAIVQWIAADVDDLARARCVADLGAVATLPDRRAEPGLDFREFCSRSKLPPVQRSWNPLSAERYRRGETNIPAYEPYNPLRTACRDCMHDPCPPGSVHQTTVLGCPRCHL